MTVLIAGGGIAGLTLGLTLHQIGVSFRVFEAVEEMRPLGVGINLQPNAVRELYDLGLTAELQALGVATKSLGFYSKTGRKIWTEPRGIAAGYRWPQFSVHRGHLQLMLRDALVRRAGSDVLATGKKATGFQQASDHVSLDLVSTKGTETAHGACLIGADGLHSAVRQQLYKAEGPPKWGGAVLWRGVTRMPAFLTGADMILAGHDTQRIVAYPISHSQTGEQNALVNWIAEKRIDPALGWREEDWNRRVAASEIAPDFADWRFDWLDVPKMIENADVVFEYPMVDRDPLERWTFDHVTLMGDAAHPTYPVGSNGASQAIVGARKLGAAMVVHGTTPAALLHYEDQMRPATSAVTRTNRTAGPDAILQRVEDACGGVFDTIDDVISHKELAAHAARYKSIAGTAIEALNNQPALIET